jgi:hypothetical protein
MRSAAGLSCDPGSTSVRDRSRQPRDVRQRLADDEVGAELDLRVEAVLDGALQGHRDRHPGGQLVHGRRQPVVGEHPRVDRADGRAEVLERGLGQIMGPAQVTAQAPDVDSAARQVAGVELGRAEGYRKGDELLLDAVVQVALDAAQVALEGPDEARTRGSEALDLMTQLRAPWRQERPRQGRLQQGEQPEDIAHDGDRDDHADESENDSGRIVDPEGVAGPPVRRDREGGRHEPHAEYVR